MHRLNADLWERLPRGFRQLAMFLAAVVSCAILRATDFRMACVVRHRMFVPTDGTSPAAVALVLLAVSVGGHWAIHRPSAFDLKHEWH